MTGVRANADSSSSPPWIDSATFAGRQFQAPGSRVISGRLINESERRVRTKTTNFRRCCVSRQSRMSCATIRCRGRIRRHATARRRIPDGQTWRFPLPFLFRTRMTKARAGAGHHEVRGLRSRARAISRTFRTSPRHLRSDFPLRQKRRRREALRGYAR